MKYIQKHNMEYDLGKHTYTVGLNTFADLTHDEFRAHYLNSKRPENRTVGATYMKPLSEGALPDTIDWRTKGYVTGVKNQVTLRLIIPLNTSPLTLHVIHFHRDNVDLAGHSPQLALWKDNISVKPEPS